VSIGSAIKAAWAKFTAAFWTGFEQARAQSRARAQPAPDRDLAAAFEAFFASETYKDALAGLIKAAFADGQNAEKARVTEILRAPGAATFPEIAVDLALGDATGAQAAAVLGRAEADAATRAGAIKSNILDRASSHVTLH
jgi:hypothetical protein